MFSCLLVIHLFSFFIFLMPIFAVPPNIETLLQIEVIREIPLANSQLSEHAISVEVALDFFNQDYNGRIRDNGLICCEVTKCDEKGKASVDYMRTKNILNRGEKFI